MVNFTEHYNIEACGEISPQPFAVPIAFSSVVSSQVGINLQDELSDICVRLLEMEKHVFLGIDDDVKYTDMTKIFTKEITEKAQLLDGAKQDIKKLSRWQKIAFDAASGSEWLGYIQLLQRYYFLLGAIKSLKDKQIKGEELAPDEISLVFNALQEARAGLSKLLPEWRVTLKPKETDIDAPSEVSCLELQKMWLEGSPSSPGAILVRESAIVGGTTEAASNPFGSISNIIDNLRELIEEMDSSANVNDRLAGIRNQIEALRGKNARLLIDFSLILHSIDPVDLTHSELDGYDEWASILVISDLCTKKESVSIADRLSTLKQTLAPYVGSDREEPEQFKTCELLLKLAEAQINLPEAKENVKETLKRLLLSLETMQHKHVERISIFGWTISTRPSRAILAAEKAIRDAFPKDDGLVVKSQRKFFQDYAHTVAKTTSVLEPYRSTARFSLWKAPKSSHMIRDEILKTSQQLTQMSRRG